MQTDTRTTFIKPALSIDEQIALLSARGLKFNDVEELRYYLTYIGYYRLSIYMRPFQDREHKFIRKCNLDDVLNFYFFDKDLRQLTFSSIKQIEIALKSVLTNAMSSEYGSHWFNRQDLFRTDIQAPSFAFQEAQRIIREVSIDCPQKKKSLFIKHFYDKYNEPELPPSWMICETLSMGGISLLFFYLHKKQRKKISEPFGQHESFLTSWIHSLTHIRNICAHHSNLWNKDFSITPVINDRLPQFQKEGYNRKKFYCQAVAIEELLNKIAPENNWNQQFNDLINKYDIPVTMMGFPVS